MQRKLFKTFNFSVKALSAGLLAASTLFVAPVANSAQLTLLSSFAQNFPFYEQIGPRFTELVKEQTGGGVDIVFNGPDTVPAFEQVAPVQAGVFDLLFTHPAYHSGTSGVGLAIDAIVNDPVKRRTEGVFDFIDKHYQSKGLKLIAMPSIGTKGFTFYLRNPITGEPGLKGQKIRGTTPYHPMIKELGGAPVNLPPTEIYTSIQRGTIDGAAFALVGAESLKWYEVAKYIAAPNFGQVSCMILMNLDKWNSLPKETQAAMTEAGKKVEIAAIEVFDKLQAQELENLKAKGMQISEFKPGEANRLEQMWSEGVWAVAEVTSKEESRQLRALAKSKGMTE